MSIKFYHKHRRLLRRGHRYHGVNTVYVTTGCEGSITRSTAGKIVLAVPGLYDNRWMLDCVNVLHICHKYHVFQLSHVWFPITCSDLFAPSFSQLPQSVCSQQSPPGSSRKSRQSRHTLAALTIPQHRVPMHSRRRKATSADRREHGGEFATKHDYNTS